MIIRYLDPLRYCRDLFRNTTTVLRTQAPMLHRTPKGSMYLCSRYLSLKGVPILNPKP